MLFTCPIVKSIWDISGETLEETFSIGKFLSLEYDIEKTNVLKYIAHYIYKFWIETTNNKNVKSLANIKFYVKKNALCQSSIEKELNNYQTSTSFRKIFEKL